VGCVFIVVILCCVMVRRVSGGVSTYNMMTRFVSEPWLELPVVAGTQVSRVGNQAARIRMNGACEY
jgi:hypothetical protein